MTTTTNTPTTTTTATTETSTVVATAVRPSWGAITVRRPGRVGRAMGALRARLQLAVSGDAGMSTVEYAIGTLAAAAFGAVLYTVVSGDSIPQALSGVIARALNTSA